MTALTRRLRSLLIALAVLALSAGAVLAGRSALSAPARPDSAVTHVDGSDTETGETERTEPAEAPETDPADTPDAETPDADAGAPAGDTPTAVHPDNHGKLVSEAAHLPTAAGSANHGEDVRAVAQNNHGHATSAAATTKHTKKTH